VQVICRPFIRRARSWLCLATLFAIALSRSFATSVIAPSFDGLVEHADLIFTGQVISQHSEWRNNNGQRSIVTLVTFGVEAIHKGQTGSTVTLQFLGGTIGDVTLAVSEMPRFNPNERVVLFVEKNGANASPLIGFYHGKFSLRKDVTGREMVLRHDGQALTDVATIGRAAPAAGPASAGLSHEEFTRQVRARVARGSTK
jgi:hypothetical protein